MLRVTILALLSLLAATASARVVTVGFAHRVFRGDDLTQAGAILAIQSTDASIVKRLRHTLLTLPADSTIITKVSVLGPLKRAVPHDVRWIWQGPNSIERVSRLQPLKRHRLEAVARRALLRKFSAGYARIKLTVLGRSTPLSVPVGALTLHANLSRHLHMAREVDIPVDVRVNGALYRSVNVWFSVHAYRKVLVYARDMSRHHVVTKSDLALQLKDVADLDKPLSERTFPATKLWLRHAVSAGEVVRRADLEAQPLVVRGENIEIRVDAGAIHISTTGVAEQSGAVGDVIRVKVPSAHSICRARVTARGEVDVLD